MPAKLKVPFRNHNRSGWWIFCEVQQWVATGQKKPQKRFKVWENTRLIQARTCEQAYRKAIKLANAGLPSKTDSGEWRFVGLSLLLPVYEDLVDGAEILWTDRGIIGTEAIRRLVKSKHKLSVSDDRQKRR